MTGQILSKSGFIDW